MESTHGRPQRTKYGDVKQRRFNNLSFTTTSESPHNGLSEGGGDGGEQNGGNNSNISSNSRRNKSQTPSNHIYSNCNSNNGSGGYNNPSPNSNWSNSNSNSNNNDSISSANNITSFSQLNNINNTNSFNYVTPPRTTLSSSTSTPPQKIGNGMMGGPKLGQNNHHRNVHLDGTNNFDENSHPDDDGGGGHEGQEFLPICDALFNVISLAAYFCDIVFDVLTAYTFYKQEMYEWSILSMIFISMSTILSQVLSLKWYKVHDKRGGQEAPCSTNVLLAMHLCLCGVLWRYFKLFIPVDLRFVKNEVRDLCLLRLVHAFCQAAPMLLIQLYLIWLKPGPDDTTDLNIVSTALSLFSVCWALASFSKNIRRQNVHKLVLTWLGVIFQFLWRLGTVTSRVIALSVYATIYTYWVFLVIILHWFSMLMWLISPKNIFHGEKMSTLKKVWYSTLIAVVYVFCYINVQETNSRQKLIIFYVTMFLENTLLFSVWLIAVRHQEFWFKDLATSLVFAGFLGGIGFMCLYYKYFHASKLSYAYESGTSSTYRESRGSSIVNGNYYANTAFSCSATTPAKGMNGRHTNGDVYYGQNGGLSLNYGRGDNTRLGGTGINNRNGNLNSPQNPSLSTPHGNGDKSGRNVLYNKINGHHIHHPNVPGVFNCRFHPAMKRKKKKPTSFVPPPAAVPQCPINNNNSSPSSPRPPSSMGGLVGGESGENNDSFISPNNKTHPSMMMNLVGMNGKMNNPFWKRPLSITMGGSENEGSVGSRVDIQQKLQEKKQQQLAELREIEEEIKQGKLKRPQMSDIPEPVNSERQPIPFEKKQPWFRTTDPPNNAQLNPRPPIIIPPTDPELVLDPSYLMYSTATTGNPNGFYEPDWNYYEPLYQNDIEVNLMRNGRESRQPPNPNPNPLVRNGGGQQPPQSRDSIYKSYRIPSDIDSQMSLPRSYTLPREFKYRKKLRKPVKTEHFLPSTNSSDGDVDSGEDDAEIYSHLRPYPLPLPSIHPVHMPNSGQGKRYAGSRRHRLHETKL